MARNIWGKPIRVTSVISPEYRRQEKDAVSFSPWVSFRFGLPYTPLAYYVESLHFTVVSTIVPVNCSGNVVARSVRWYWLCVEASLWSCFIPITSYSATHFPNTIVWLSRSLSKSLNSTRTMFDLPVDATTVDTTDATARGARDHQSSPEVLFQLYSTESLSKATNN